MSAVDRFFDWKGAVWHATYGYVESPFITWTSLISYNIARHDIKAPVVEDFVFLGYKRVNAPSYSIQVVKVAGVNATGDIGRLQERSQEEEPVWYSVSG